MNDDYLWDRSGEPDPDVQELEQVLGTLRYQVQPLQLPAGIRPERGRSYFPRLAIAAAIALMILTAGFWVRIHRSQTPTTGEVANGLPTATGEKNRQEVAAASPTPAPVNQQVAVSPKNGTPVEERTVRHRKPFVPGNSLAKNSVAPHDDLSIAQLDEARAAKEQLMLALRVASAKLNFAQRKTQGVAAPSTIRNQHKVG
jgi:hypothetical protein